MNAQRGQILLITLLVLSVATTIVLSLIARSATDVSISNQIGESAKALNAAEAGIEESLKSAAGATGTAGGANFISTVSGVGGTSSIYQFPKKTTVDSVETLWLVNHTSGAMDELTSAYTANTLIVCWSDETITPALLISVWYKHLSDGSYRVARMAVDPDSARAAQNHFDSSVDSPACGYGTTLKYLKLVHFNTLVGADLSSNTGDRLLFLRIQPVYSDTNIAVVPAVGNLPSQGSKIDSVGSVASGITRKVVVYQQYKSPAPIFDNVIYSQGTFSQ